MGTLTEIKTAADALTPEQKQELLIFLASQLRQEPMPEPRDFSSQQLADWIAEDEADMKKFHGEK